MPDDCELCRLRARAEKAEAMCREAHEMLPDKVRCHNGLVDGLAIVMKHHSKAEARVRELEAARDAGTLVDVIHLEYDPLGHLVGSVRQSDLDRANRRIRELEEKLALASTQCAALLDDTTKAHDRIKRLEEAICSVMDACPKPNSLSFEGAYSDGWARAALEIAVKGGMTGRKAGLDKFDDRGPKGDAGEPKVMWKCERCGAPHGDANDQPNAKATVPFSDGTFRCEARMPLSSCLCLGRVVRHVFRDGEWVPEEKGEPGKPAADGKDINTRINRAADRFFAEHALPPKFLIVTQKQHEAIFASTGIPVTPFVMGEFTYCTYAGHKLVVVVSDRNAIVPDDKPRA